MCAPAAILTEAGGFVCDTDGQRPLNIMNRRLIAACSQEVAKELGESLVNQLELPPDDK